MITYLVQRHYEIWIDGQLSYANTMRAALALVEMFSTSSTKSVTINKREIQTPYVPDTAKNSEPV